MNSDFPKSRRAHPRNAMLCLCALLVLPATAHAYIDPGTGSLLFQSLLAVLFGVGAAFGRLRAWVAKFFRSVLKRPHADDPSE